MSINEVRSGLMFDDGLFSGQSNHFSSNCCHKVVKRVIFVMKYCDWDLYFNNRMTNPFI